jgi:8-oxo-dGTP diphosphatase
MEHTCVARALRRSDRLLLCLRVRDSRWDPGVWDLPGGHLEPGETPSVALARELHDELGITIDPPPVSAHAEITAAGLSLSIWLLDSWMGEARNVDHKEHEEVGWFTANEFPDLPFAHPGYPNVLTTLLKL